MAIEVGGHAVWGGEYEIQEPLAQGGMATVYTARARSLDTTVAIKVLSPRLARDPSFLERFHAEATNIAALHHPNIIEVHHFAVENGIAYIAMRYVPGGTLKERLQLVSGQMNLNSAAKLTAQVAAALQYAHERGLVHLDVKPGNILLGSADWPLLSDFGIIRIAGDAREEGHRVAGTPAYMSPEQWQGGDVDGRSDQYSLGIMFYEIVTGRRPFAGETSVELKAQHIDVAPPRPREINPGIPGPVEEVMLRALEKRPEDRFPTIGEFGTALVEAAERSRGMQLETKQAIISAAPNLVALVALSVVAPLLASLPSPDLPVFRELTLNWPVSLITALLQIILLLGIRWQLIGIVTRFLGAIVDALDQFTRTYVRIGTDTEGVFRVKAWRNAVVGSGEAIVNIAYLFIIYQIVALPLIKTASLAIDPGLEALIATGIVGIVVLAAAAIVLKLFRTTGPVIALWALTVCWAFISAMPLVDEEIWGHVSLQWLIKLGVGLAVLATCLAVRKRVQAVVREYVGTIVDQQVRGVRKGQTAEQIAERREGVGRAIDGLVNVVYLIVGYPIIALPLRNVLVSFVSDELAAILITVGVFLVAAVLVNQLRVASGVVPSTLGLLICAPMLLGLPLFEPGLLGGPSLQWAGRFVIGLGVLALFLGIRGRVQAVGRAVLVPLIDHQLSSLRPSHSEAEEAARHRVFEGSADALVNVLYLIIAYFAVVGPVAGDVAGAMDLGWVSALMYALFVLIVIYVLYRFVRGVAPALRPAVALA
ncbi:MAG TPA: serine/threonine-protein kinase [Chloroflexota bacterium]|nr:serine/threonine-protein kinase [Chloroflexota bacterium]